MILTIWRHGEAEHAPTDRERELTDQGFDDVGFGCRQFHAALDARDMPPPQLILCSPWVRTVQTAKVVASAFTHASLREHEALRPDGTVKAVESALLALDDAGTVSAHIVLVSHQPLVSRLAEHFLQARGLVPSLCPGSLVTLSLATPAAGCGTLNFWAMPPEYQAGI